MKRRGLVPLISGILIVGTAFIGYWYYTQRPKYCLRALGRAIEARDLTAAERYLDIRALSTQVVAEIVDAAAADIGPSAAGQENAFGVVGQMMGLAMLDRMKPSMAKVVERQIRRAIATGRPDSDVSTGTGDSRVAATGGVLRKFSGDEAASFAGYGATRVQRDSAFVDLRFYDADLDTTFSLVAAMARFDGRWRVVGLKDVGDLAVSLEPLQLRRLEAANEPIRRRLARMIAVGRLHSELRQEDWLTRKLVLRAAVANRTRVPIEGLVVRVTGPRLRSSTEPRLVLLQPRLAPGAVGEVRHVMDYYEVIDAHRALRQTPAIYELQPERVVVLAGGKVDTMQTFTYWESYRAARARARRQAGAR